MLNHIVVMGRLTRDPEMRSTGSGVQVANFTVAVDRDFSGKDGGEKETDFIDCVAWRKTAEFVQKYFAKGKMAVVSGRLQIRRWNDKDGNQRRSAEIQVDNIYFGESKGQSGGIQGGVAPAMGYENTMDYMQNRYGVSAVPTSEYAALTDDDDQLPF
jgi:single-strand DNA-binding protein